MTCTSDRCVAAIGNEHRGYDLLAGKPERGNCLLLARSGEECGWLDRLGDVVVHNAVAAPPAPVVTGPANGATGVSATPVLRWIASSEATSYDVYFGTVASPPLATNIAGTAYSPGSLVRALFTTGTWWRRTRWLDRLGDLVIYDAGGGSADAGAHLAGEWCDRGVGDAGVELDCVERRNFL